MTTRSSAKRSRPQTPPSSPLSDTPLAQFSKRPHLKSMDGALDDRHTEKPVDENHTEKQLDETGHADKPRVDELTGDFDPYVWLCLNEDSAASSQRFV